jgi:hypothetical protein
MISTKLLNLTLDNIKNANPVAEFAENLHNQGVTEEQLTAALNGRNDTIAGELLEHHRAIRSGIVPMNKYGVAKRTNSTRPSKKT